MKATLLIASVLAFMVCFSPRSDNFTQKLVLKEVEEKISSAHEPLFMQWHLGGRMVYCKSKSGDGPPLVYYEPSIEIVSVCPIFLFSGMDDISFCVTLRDREGQAETFFLKPRTKTRSISIEWQKMDSELLRRICSVLDVSKD